MLALIYVCTDDMCTDCRNKVGVPNYLKELVPDKVDSPYDKGPILTYCTPPGGVTVLYTNGSPGAWGV